MMTDIATQGGHWEFLGWSDGGSGNPRHILVTSDTAIVAIFEWVSDTTGIEEIENSRLKIEIYPNPASTDVTVHVSEPATLTVIDLQGRTVIPPTPIDSTLIIQHSSLLTGTYFVRIVTEGGVTVKKLILQ